MKTIRFILILSSMLMQACGVTSVVGSAASAAIDVTSTVVTTTIDVVTAPITDD